MKTITRMILIAAVVSAAGIVSAQDSQKATLTIEADKGKDTISRMIYGQFAEHLGHCIYGGLWVGEDSPIPNTRGIRNDVVAALKAIRVPVVRWPGGCFADEYHWTDGIGPKEKRPTMINTHWGGVTENNHFGTHEFFELCEQLGCEPYITGNVGSGSVEEMADWIEYMTFDGVSPMAELRKQNGREKPWKLKYFAVGNENWGCGGNMRPEFYADQYRRYATYVRNYSGNQIFKVGCGQNGDDIQWTETVMQMAGNRMAGIAPHYYCGSGRRSRSATQFSEVDWFEQLNRALRIETLLQKQKEVMDKYDPRKRVAIIFDEWGAWHQVEPGTNPGFLFQQNSLRDAMVAGLTLNIFNNHCDRVKMANIAQMVNVLQAMVLTDDKKMVLTPTYFVFMLYMVHHDATLLPTQLQSPEYAFENNKLPAMNVSASRDQSGKIHVTLCNIDTAKPITLEASLQGAKAGKISGQILTAEAINSHNTFDKPDGVKPEDFNDAKPTDGGFTATIPAKSIVMLEITG